MTTLERNVQSIKPGQRKRKPKVACLGVGWIGLNRMRALVEKDVAEIVAVADPSEEQRNAAGQWAPDALHATSFEDLLSRSPDGVVIATPSAYHAEQSVRALENGCAVFCQKPLSRTAPEARQVIKAARKADRLLGIDLSYRHMEGTRLLRYLLQKGGIGEIYAVNAVFHNAYGPDKEWFYDPRRSGGGCLIDLGIHLIDLVVWLLDSRKVTDVHSKLYSKGMPLTYPSDSVEDFASIKLELDHRVDVGISCSWNLPAGRDAIIELTMYGTKGGVSIQNVEGSFFDFTTSQFLGTATDVLQSPPDAWGGRAIVDWAERLGHDSRYDPEVEHAVATASVIDSIYSAARKKQ